LEIGHNQLNGSDLADLKELYPKLQKLKIGSNPIKSLDVFKVLVIIIFNFSEWIWRT